METLKMIEISNKVVQCLRCRIEIWFGFGKPGNGREDVLGPGCPYSIVLRYVLVVTKGCSLGTLLLYRIVQASSKERNYAFFVYLGEA